MLPPHALPTIASYPSASSSGVFGRAPGYSQNQFAPVVKKHRTYMGLVERGKANPTMKTLRLVAEGLGITVPRAVCPAAAEDSGTIGVPGEDRLGVGRDPAPLVENPIQAPRREKASAPIARKPKQKRRKPGR